VERLRYRGQLVEVEAVAVLAGSASFTARLGRIWSHAPGRLVLRMEGLVPVTRSSVTEFLRHRLGAIVAVVVLLGSLAACTRAGAGRSPVAQPARAAVSTSPTARVPASTSASASSPTPAPPTSRLPPRFLGQVSPLPADLAAQMRGTTWQPGCPVPLRELRLLTLRYWGFDGQVHQGPMVVNQAVTGQVVSVFRRLFQVRFPIQQLHLAVQYRPDQDDPNDTRNYTDGFNCRPVVTARGPLSRWSQHAFGLAVDINPIQNPYVASDGYVRNHHARPYRDRSLRRPAMIHSGDAVVRAFAAVGWGWGGSWTGAKDFMHFSSTGR
jgi:D-alanyl-D-alanine carboxypeptidase